jgi:hypothetical protein
MDRIPTSDRHKDKRLEKQPTVPEKHQSVDFPSLESLQQNKPLLLKISEILKKEEEQVNLNPIAFVTQDIKRQHITRKNTLDGAIEIIEVILEKKTFMRQWTHKKWEQLKTNPTLPVAIKIAEALEKAQAQEGGASSSTRDQTQEPRPEAGPPRDAGSKRETTRSALYPPLDTVYSNPEHDSIKARTKRIKEPERKAIREYQLDNLTNTYTTIFRTSAAASKNRASYRGALITSSKILDDYVGRRISGQNQIYARKEVLDALEEIAEFHVESTQGTILRDLQQELNGLRDKYLLEKSTNPSSSQSGGRGQSRADLLKQPLDVFRGWDVDATITKVMNRWFKPEQEETQPQREGNSDTRGKGKGKEIDSSSMGDQQPQQGNIPEAGPSHRDTGRIRDQAEKEKTYEKMRINKGPFFPETNYTIRVAHVDELKNREEGLEPGIHFLHEEGFEIYASLEVIKLDRKYYYYCPQISAKMNELVPGSVSSTRDPISTVIGDIKRGRERGKVGQWSIRNIKGNNTNPSST